MNQKGFVNILIVILIIVVAGAVGYFILSKNSSLTTQLSISEDLTQTSNKTAGEKNVSHSIPTSLEGFQKDICNRWEINGSSETPKCHLSSGSRNLEIKWNELAPGEGELVIWNYSDNKNCTEVLNEDLQVWKQMTPPEDIGEKTITEITTYKPLKINNISFRNNKQEIYEFCSLDNSFKFYVTRKEIVEKLYNQYFKY